MFTAFSAWMMNYKHDSLGRFARKEIIMADETGSVKDLLTSRMIAVVLGVALVAAVGDMLFATYLGKEIPPEVMTLATLLTGGFLAFLNPQATGGK